MNLVYPDYRHKSVSEMLKVKTFQDGKVGVNFNPSRFWHIFEILLFPSSPYVVGCVCQIWVLTRPQPYKKELPVPFPSCPCVSESTTPPLSLQLRVYDEPDRKTVGCGNSFPKQEVRRGGSTTKLMHVAVTKSTSVFNQRAVVSHDQEGRAPHSVISSRSPHQNAAPCLTSCSPLFHRQSWSARYNRGGRCF